MSTTTLIRGVPAVFAIFVALVFVSCWDETSLSAQPPPSNATDRSTQTDTPVEQSDATITAKGATDADLSTETDASNSIDTSAGWNQEQRTTRAAMLIGSFTVFLLAVFVGFEIITKVPPTLHTPLMSGSNAISGITIVGAILTAGHALGGFGSFLGMLAVILATINVVGGFLVTHRMLMMFKKR